MTGWNPFAARPSDDERPMDSLSPNDAETARVRDLLSRLATEPLPPTTATRLTARLDQELPAPAPRRRLLAHGYRRAALGAIVPLAIGVAIAFAVYSQDSGGVRDRGVFAPLSTAPALADEDAAGSSSSAASSSAAAAATAAGVPTNSVAAAPVETELSPSSATRAPDGTMKAASGAAGTGVMVPSVVSRYPTDAIAVLARRGLRVRFASAPAIERAGGNVNGYGVSAQRPAGGASLAPGSTVVLRLEISTNLAPAPAPVPTPRSVRVPTVVGLDANLALRHLVDAGLLVTIRGSTTPLARLAIAAQDVPAGSSVRSGTVVTLSFAR